MRNKGKNLAWKSAEIQFDPHIPLKTDMVLYEELSGLLIPDPGQWNTFSIKCDRSETQYYISSTCESGIDNLSAFFSKLYRCRVKSGSVSAYHKKRRFFISPKFRVRNRKFSYTPSLLRTIVRGPSIFSEMDMSLNVTLTSAKTIFRKRLRYSFWMDVGFSGEVSHSENLKILIESSLNKMILDNGIPLKILRENKKSFYSYPLTFRDPADLVNVIRIIEDENLTLDVSQQAMQERAL